MSNDRYDVCVIGCGQIGSEVLKELAKKNNNVCGVDVSYDMIQQLRNHGYKMSMDIPEATNYFICVWNTETVLETLTKLQNRPYCKSIFIETTIDISYRESLYHLITSSDLLHKVAVFPHRFNPFDDEHHIFNQSRVIGHYTGEAESKSLAFLLNYMKPEHLFYTTPEIAMMTKIAENTYRAWEIILAQELKKSADSIGVPFHVLRNAMNTKWNIDVREPRDGVKGKCLPKDLKLFNKAFPGNLASNMLYLLNEQFIKDCDKNGNK